MSIVRVGLAETKKFAEGYDAIFRKKKKEAPAEPAVAKVKKKAAAPKKNAGAKKK